MQASITSPTSPPYVAKQLTALFHTQTPFSFPVNGNVLKPSPALEAPGHDHLLGLAYDRKTWACPMSTVLATVAFLLLLDTSLLSQAGTSHYSQLLTLQHSTKLPNFTDRERMKTPKTDCALKVYKDKEFYQLGFQVC